MTAGSSHKVYELWTGDLQDWQGREREEGKKHNPHTELSFKTSKVLKMEIFDFIFLRLMTLFENINIGADTGQYLENTFLLLLLFQSVLVSCILLLKKKSQSWSTSAQNTEQTTASFVFNPCTEKAGIFPFCTWFTVCCSDANQASSVYTSIQISKGYYSAICHKRSLWEHRTRYFRSPHQKLTWQQDPA